MYGPAVRCKRFSSSWRLAVLHQCIRPLIGAFAPGHHGYQRACVLINGQASTGHQGHQCSHAPERPILHLYLSSRRPRLETVDRTMSSLTPHFSQFLCSSLARAVPSSRPAERRARREDQAGRTPASSVLVSSKARPLASTAQAMRASLLASAIASTLWCNRLLAASIQDLSP